MWKAVKLGDICELVYGKGLPKEERVESDGFPAYGANGIKTYSVKALYDKPSIIVGRKGSAGEIQKVDAPFWALDVTYYIVHREGLVDLDYLYFLLKLQNLPSLARGVKPGINRNDVYSISIQLPPLAEQQRIVAKLDAAFAEIDTAIAAVEKKKNQAIKLFQRVLSSSIIKKYEHESSLALKEIAKFLDYRGKTPAKTESGIRLLTAKNVRMGFIKKHPEEFVSEEGYKQHMTRGFPKVGDVVFTTEAPLGLVAQIEDDSFALGQRLITFQILNNVIKSTYLKFALMSETYQKVILEKGTGATVKGIKASLLKEIKITYPVSLDEQGDRITLIEEAEKNCYLLQVNYTKQISSYQSLKSSILAQELQSEAA